MRQVALPDPVYAEAVRAAEAKGQSVEEYVLETVRRGLARVAEVTPVLDLEE